MLNRLRWNPKGIRSSLDIAPKGVLWYPTQAKERLEWGTQRLLPVKRRSPE